MCFPKGPANGLSQRFAAKFHFSRRLHNIPYFLYITYIIYINFIYITYIIYRCSMSKYLLNYTGKRPQTLWGVRKSMHQLQAREAMEQQQIRRNRSG